MSRAWGCKQVAAYLGLSVETVQQLAASGLLPMMKRHGKWQVGGQEVLDRWMLARTRAQMQWAASWATVQWADCPGPYTRRKRATPRKKWLKDA